MRDNKIKKTQKGGDGYSVNVLQPIGGMPSYLRYGYNCKPVFDGELLHRGGGDHNHDKKCNCDKDEMKGERTFNDMLKEHKELENKKINIQLGGGKNKLMKGGFVETSTISQFAPIQALTKILTPLGTGALISLVLLLFMHQYVTRKKKKSKSMMEGGYIPDFQKLLAPMGRENLIVMGAIMLLHHFAVEKKRGKKMIGGGETMNVMNKLLGPTGKTTKGNLKVIMSIRKGFMMGGKRKKIEEENKMGGKKSDIKKKKSKKLSELISKIPKTEFEADGLLVSLDKLFLKKIKELKENNKTKIENIKKNLKKRYDEVFDMIAPITFSSFVNQSSFKRAKAIKNYMMHQELKNKK